MEPEAYKDQLLAALRQMRAQVIETEDVEAIRHELNLALGDALAMVARWAGNKRPPPLPPGAGFAEIGEQARQLGEIEGREGEMVEALQAISPDFSVEAIDNAIRVVERLA